MVKKHEKHTNEGPGWLAELRPSHFEKFKRYSKA
jgi:hypothetical protein